MRGEALIGSGESGGVLTADRGTDGVALGKAAGDAAGFGQGFLPGSEGKELALAVGAGSDAETDPVPILSTIDLGGGG